MTPFVQTRLVTYFADLLGKRLGTEIVIGKVDFRPIESLVLSDVYVKGFANDTLLYCRRLTARVDSVSFVRRRATVTELDFDGAVFNLWVSRDSAGSRTNVEMLLDPLSREGAGSSRPGSPGWRVSLERIRLRNSRLRYMEDQYEPVEYGINWTDVDCRGLDADISGISFDGGTYAAEVSGLRFREKSGFRVNRMGGRVVIREDNMLITSADISTDKSFIHLDTLRYDWVPDRKYWKYFVHKMRQRYVFSNTAVNFDDLAYFNGRLLGMENTVSGSGVVTGTIDSLSGERLDLALGDTTRLRGSFRSRGLPRIFETDFDITLDDCLASPAELERLYLPWIDPHYLDFPDPVHKIGAYRLAIDFKGRLEDFVVEAESGTFGALGSVRLAYEADSAAYRYSGGMDMRRVDYGLFTGLCAFPASPFSTAVSAASFSTSTTATGVSPFPPLSTTPARGPGFPSTVSSPTPSLPPTSGDSSMSRNGTGLAPPSSARMSPSPRPSPARSARPPTTAAGRFAWTASATPTRSAPSPSTPPGWRTSSWGNTATSSWSPDFLTPPSADSSTTASTTTFGTIFSTTTSPPTSSPATRLCRRT